MLVDHQVEGCRWVDRKIWCPGQCGCPKEGTEGKTFFFFVYSYIHLSERVNSRFRGGLQLGAVSPSSVFLCTDPREDE